jgi:hypothetical protein
LGSSFIWPAFLKQLKQRRKVTEKVEKNKRQLK